MAGGVVERRCIDNRASSLAANSLGASFAFTGNTFPAASREKGIVESIQQRLGRITNRSSRLPSVGCLWASRGIGCLGQIDRLWIGSHRGNERMMDAWELLNYVDVG